MSTISLNAGSTSWCDSITCDLCDAKVERKSTGELKRVALPIDDPRVIERNRPTGWALPEIEYEERSYDSNALKGWGHFGTRGASDDDLRPSMDLCPSCAQVICDLLLEHAKPGTNAPFGTRTETKYGHEVPARPMFTNLSAARELGEAIGSVTVRAMGLGYLPPMPQPQPIPHLRAGPEPLRLAPDARRRDGTLVGSNE